MQLLLVGVSHRTAPIELRERLDFSARGVDRALTALSNVAAQHEATIVSTCNRVELYVGCDDPAVTRSAIQAFLAEFHGIPDDQLAPHIYAKTGQDAVTHLFRVASGLDSLVMVLPPRAQFWCEAIVFVFSIVFAVVLFAGASEMAVSTHASTIPTLGISEAVRYVPILAAGVLITLFSIEHLVAQFAGKEVVPSWH